ncbi:MAG: LUD domain-containing protein [Anaerolineales bacterium]|nr:LUD domain-containing protein [Anaerolineales bacterium]
MTLTSFKTRIRQSIADENLQLALDNNAQRRRDGRLAAFASLPDYKERRARAHAIKADVIANLDEYLYKFIAKVTENGILVHRAADAAEAVRIVLEIVKDLPQRSQRLALSEAEGNTKDSFVPLRDLRGKKLVAKSKSMVAEEINLNHALEAAGIRVVETDLGEYIVQLRGERPSHIITPAVHLRRGDVGQLFHEKLGIPYTEDIPILTNTARKVLREVFLTADIGLSGVNFGVAETGTLCLVTNEGNGRMCTTLPPVHIALMGIERLVPTLDDLALMLSLLPRSATGQKLSVYTSLIHSPRRPPSTSLGTGADPDGPFERHLILLDNGRSALRHSLLAESLYCIRCGACLNACPVFRELGGHAYGSIYPGPIGSVISAALVDPNFAYLAQASSLCGACKEACPVDIDLPGLLLRVRGGEGVKRKDVKRNPAGIGLPASVKLGLKAFRLVAATPRLFAVLQTLGGLFSRLYSPRRAWMRLPAWTGWGYSKDLPRLAARPFRARWKNVKQSIKETSRQVDRGQVDKGQVDREEVGLVDQFTRELTALGGQVHLVPEGELSAKLSEFLRSKGVNRVQADESVAKYISGIPAIREPDASTWLSTSPTIRAGVTGAVCGIAESGSLLLISGTGQTLTASLLPEVHVAVLKTSEILPNLADALRRPEVRAADAGVIVTGPSRTADIEMTLTIGVHGPGELHVFLIDDSETV